MLTAAAGAQQQAGYRIDTFAGLPEVWDNGPATEARLDSPSGVATDGAGNLYIADFWNHRIRKVDSLGDITTVAGSEEYGYGGDGGRAIAAQLYRPSDVAVDGAGNLYIADAGNDRIRKVDSSGVITTIAGTGAAGFGGDGGQATAAQLDNPYGVVLDGAGNLYIADRGNHRIRKVDTTGVITTIAGTGAAGFGGDGGQATAAQLDSPSGVVLDSSGNLYIADRGNHRIRKVDTTGVITTIAGTGAEGFSGDGGQATAAQLDNPSGVVLDSSGNLYIADRDNHRIRKVDTTGVITTIAGTGVEGFGGDGGPATAAQLDSPSTVALDSAGNLYIADRGNDRVRKVDSSGVITTVAGSAKSLFGGDGGQATAAQLDTPYGVVLDGVGNLYIADGLNHRIRKVDSSGVITTVAGSEEYGHSGDGGQATNAGLAFPRGVAVDGVGNLYIADYVNHRIRKVDSSGVITTIAGSGGISFGGDGGPAVNAQLYSPTDVALDSAGNLFIADRYNHRIRKVDAGGTITTVAGMGATGLGAGGFSGDGGPAVNAMLEDPHGVAVDGAGNLYIADRDNHRIRKVDTSGLITTVAGTGERGFGGDGGPAAAARLAFPHGVAVDAAGNLYIADTSNHRIRKVDSSGVIRTIAGTGERGFRGNGVLATNAWLDLPFGVAVDGSGNIYIADTGTDRIRLLTPLPTSPPPPPPPPPPAPPPPPDEDDDGVLNSIEEGAPNDGDGNADGVADAEQSHVVSFPNAFDSRYVTLEAPRLIRITDTRTFPRPPRDIPPPPPEAAFPIGLLEFRLSGVIRGRAAAVTLYLPETVVFNSYWKYGPTPDQAEPHWYPFDYDGETGARFLETGEIVLRFIDGARGDDDLLSNGEIVDLGGSALTIPALAPLTLDLSGEDVAVGLALHNPTPAANAVTLSLVDAAGATLQAVELEEALAGKGQRAWPACELLDCSEENGASAVIARGRQSHLQSLFMVGDHAGRKLDGLSGEFEAARRLYFPIVEPGRHGATRFFVFNPTLQETAVTFTLYREDGGPVAEASRPTAGGGFVNETAESLFAGADDSAHSYVEARAEKPLVGFAFLHDDDSYAALAGRPFPRNFARSSRLYAPHFAVGRGSATKLYLLSSLARHATRVRIRAFDNDGNPLGEGEQELAADTDGLLLAADVGELLSLNPTTRQDGLLEGYLQLDFSVTRGQLRIFASPRVLGAVAVVRDGARTVLPLAAAEGSLNSSFLQVAHSELPGSNMYTALWILNPGPETAMVRVRVFDQTGDPSSSERILAIVPGARCCGELEEPLLFGPTFRQVGGHLQVSSDRPVISFAVFGDRAGQFLVAIPGRRMFP